MNISVIANIIGDFCIFLTLSGDETVDPQEATTMRDWLGGRLRELDGEPLRQIVDSFDDQAAEQRGRVQEVLHNLGRDLHLHDALATGAPGQVHEPHDRRVPRQLARIIADTILFLELTGEDKLNLDDSVKMMEMTAGSLGEVDKPLLRELVDAFAEIAPEYGQAGEATVRDIARAYSLEEVLAADDPVRLAELEALDDAHEFEGRDDPFADFPGVDWRADVRRPYLAAT